MPEQRQGLPLLGMSLDLLHLGEQGADTMEIIKANVILMHTMAENGLSPAGLEALDDQGKTAFMAKVGERLIDVLGEQRVQALIPDYNPSGTPPQS